MVGDALDVPKEEEKTEITDFGSSLLAIQADPDATTERNSKMLNA